MDDLVLASCQAVIAAGSAPADVARSADALLALLRHGQPGDPKLLSPPRQGAQQSSLRMRELHQHHHQHEEQQEHQAAEE